MCSYLEYSVKYLAGKKKWRVIIVCISGELINHKFFPVERRIVNSVLFDNKSAADIHLQLYLKKAA